MTIRCTSRHWARVCPTGLWAGSLHLSILVFQKAKPAWSASRFRKSWYCCLTKLLVSSIAFGVGEAESLIVTVALDGFIRTAPPVGLDSLTVKVSGPSV